MNDQDTTPEAVDEEIYRMKELNDKKEIIGLTARDLSIIQYTVRHATNSDYAQFVPSIDLALPSGIRGRLVRKPNIGYVFAVDISSLL